MSVAQYQSFQLLLHITDCGIVLSVFIECFQRVYAVDYELLGFQWPYYLRVELSEVSHQ